MLHDCPGFEWDEGNSGKNWIKHRVSRSECEQVFFNEPIMVVSDHKHSVEEKRWYVLGHTDLDRYLFLVFTVCKNLIRVISARGMSKKERLIYEEKVR